MRRSQAGLFHHRLNVGHTSATNAAEQMAMVAIPIQIIKHTHLLVTWQHWGNGLQQKLGRHVILNDQNGGIGFQSPCVRSFK